MLPAWLWSHWSMDCWKPGAAGSWIEGYCSRRKRLLGSGRAAVVTICRSDSLRQTGGGSKYPKYGPTSSVHPRRGPTGSLLLFRSTTMTKTTTAKPAAAEESDVVLFGLDETGKPQAARFSRQDADLAAKAAGVMGLTVCTVSSPELTEIARQLPAGRIHANGRSFVPNVRRDLYAITSGLRKVRDAICNPARNRSFAPARFESSCKPSKHKPSNPAGSDFGLVASVPFRKSNKSTSEAEPWQRPLIGLSVTFRCSSGGKYEISDAAAATKRSFSRSTGVFISFRCVGSLAIGAKYSSGFFPRFKVTNGAPLSSPGGTSYQTFRAAPMQWLMRRSISRTTCAESCSKLRTNDAVMSGTLMRRRIVR
jgi:hypothetical protein